EPRRAPGSPAREGGLACRDGRLHGFLLMVDPRRLGEQEPVRLPALARVPDLRARAQGLGRRVGACALCAPQLGPRRRGRLQQRRDADVVLDGARGRAPAWARGAPPETPDADAGDRAPARGRARARARPRGLAGPVPGVRAARPRLLPRARLRLRSRQPRGRALLHRRGETRAEPCVAPRLPGRLDPRARLGGLEVGPPAAAFADAVRAGRGRALARARPRRLPPEPAAAGAARARRGDLERASGTRFVAG